MLDLDASTRPPRPNGMGYNTDECKIQRDSA